jgi:hypothetical protein
LQGGKSFLKSSTSLPIAIWLSGGFTDPADTSAPGIETNELFFEVP